MNNTDELIDIFFTEEDNQGNILTMSRETCAVLIDSNDKKYIDVYFSEIELPIKHYLTDEELTRIRKE